MGGLGPPCDRWRHTAVRRLFVGGKSENEIGSVRGGGALGGMGEEVSARGRGLAC